MNHTELGITVRVRIKSATAKFLISRYVIRFEGVLALTTTCSPTELPNSDITKIVMYAKVNPTLVSVGCKGGDMTLFIRILV